MKYMRFYACLSTSCQNISFLENIYIFHMMLNMIQPGLCRYCKLIPVVKIKIIMNNLYIIIHTCSAYCAYVIVVVLSSHWSILIMSCMRQV